MTSRVLKWTAIAFLVLLANSFYLAAFASPTIFYMTNVLAHLALGAAAALGLAWGLMKSDEFRARVKWASVPLLASAIAGGALIYTGALIEFRWILWTHIALAFAGVVLLIPTAKWRALNWTFSVGLLALTVIAGIGAAFPDKNGRISNSMRVPTSMAEEGGGPKSPFWPSSAKTNVGGTIPSNFFMDSKLCGECHQDIYKQWESSMHHFASFNNQFYRKSIEYMQEVSGTQSSKWCAGCHDHAVLFSGNWEKPIKGQIDGEEAQAGLGCVSCHSIMHIDSSMGNGGFTIEYPPLHHLAASRDPWIRRLDKFLTYTEPEPHRRTFMQPFMRKDSAEFCSTCHKVHLDQPVNNYRWARGFNDYDNWQASGVSGQGARSFYYPEKSAVCADCHMPLAPSKDPGHRNGMVHNHRFAAANMAVPFANGDETQMKAVEGFLKSGFISVDIFAASPADGAPGLEMARRGGESAQQSMTTFAVGEEAEGAGPVFIREVGKLAAPLNQAGVKFKPGSTAKVDVVVRTRKIGHFFPGGTVDAFDVWVELQGKDATGKTIFWSGRVEDGGKGPVEAGAHMYKSYLLDGNANPIDKRNAWMARSVLYVRLIPPGAADVAHYRVKIPKDAKGPITLTAKLNYRKFSWQYTRFSYTGEPKPNQDPLLVSKHYDNREYDYSLKNIPANVSGKIKNEIPVLPIVTLASAETKLELGDARTETDWKPVVRKQDRERWNDWGIGLLLQGDLKGAEYAFMRVTEADPDYADGWLNVARALIQEGETEAAKPYIEKALKINDQLGRIHFFKAMVEKADGDYEAALASLQRVAVQYPRDRVVQNQTGRILFLKRDYQRAIAAFQQVLRVDPEDVQAHYNLMLCYRGAGDMENAQREERLFKRFKADESSQTITAKRRLISAEDNNERQQIHDHESVSLP